MDEGKEVFYGPLKEARPFMEELGFVCREGSNVADYLTGVLVPTERLIKPGCERTFPRTATTLRAIYDKSPISTRMLAEYDYPTTEQAKEKTDAFQRRIAIERHERLPNNSPFTVSFPTQIRAAIKRQYQIIWGDKPAFFIKQIATLFQALIAGSLFYGHPEDMHSGVLFGRSGALFFSILHNSLMSMSEVPESFSSRDVILKHKAFRLFHPAAFCFAQIAADIPIILVQITVFALPLYFMAGLTLTASVFFTYWILLFAVTMVRFPAGSACLGHENLLTLLTADHDSLLPVHRSRLSHV